MEAPFHDKAPSFPVEVIKTEETEKRVDLFLSLLHIRWLPLRMSETPQKANLEMHVLLGGSRGEVPGEYPVHSNPYQTRQVASPVDTRSVW